MTVRDISTEKKFEINVVNGPIIIRYIYGEYESYFSMKEDVKVEDILKSIAEQIYKKFDSIYFLYNGELISNEKFNCTFDNFASKWDKEVNYISIVVVDKDDDDLYDYDL